jgi:hypothetical protein
VIAVIGDHGRHAPMPRRPKSRLMRQLTRRLTPLLMRRLTHPPKTPKPRSRT